MGTVANLLAGQITIYTAATATSLPELDDLTPPTIVVTAAGWTALPFTMDETDYSLEYTPTFGDPHWVNEETVPVKEPVLLQEDAILKVTIAEDDMLAWDMFIAAATLATQSAGANVTAQDQVGVGGATSYDSISGLLLGTSPEAGSRVVHIYEMFSSAPAVLAFTKDKRPGREITYQLVGDSTKTAGEKLFKAYDITAAASS